MRRLCSIRDSATKISLKKRFWEARDLPERFPESVYTFTRLWRPDSGLRWKFEEYLTFVFSFNDFQVSLIRCVTIYLLDGDRYTDVSKNLFGTVAWAQKDLIEHKSRSRQRAATQSVLNRKRKECIRENLQLQLCATSIHHFHSRIASETIFWFVPIYHCDRIYTVMIYTNSNIRTWNKKSLNR